MPSNSYENSTRLSGHPPLTPGSLGTPPSLRAIEPSIQIGSRTLFGTVNGTLGSILGLDLRTATFFTALERAMARIIRPIGNLRHDDFRAFRTDTRTQPARGFVDGDLVESFWDLDGVATEAIVAEMNRDGRWEVDDDGEGENGVVGGLEDGTVGDGRRGGNNTGVDGER